jgi:uncharacterized protein YndB with AHSA1/START domain
VDAPDVVNDPVERFLKEDRVMTDILHRIRIDAPPEKVVAAISTADGIRSWWTEDCEVTPREGVTDVFRFGGGSIEFHFHVDELSNSRVAWTCVPAAKTPAEWVATRVEFGLRSDGHGQTTLSFAHRGWASAEGELPQCNTVWGELMHRLKAAAEGHPRGPYFT